MWHKQSFTQFWSQSDAYSRRSSLKLTYIHHPLVVCTHQICCAVAVPIALSQDRLLHGHNRLVNWTPCSRMRESKLKNSSHSPVTNLCITNHSFSPVAPGGDKENSVRPRWVNGMFLNGIDPLPEATVLSIIWTWPTNPNSFFNGECMCNDVSKWATSIQISGLMTGLHCQ